jgi:protein-tyrosine-phosphatase
MASPSARSFVFVCYGNIMRSALAEFLMRQALRDARLTGQVQIVSAGLHASPGHEAHPWAQQAAAELGISLAEHHAKTFSLNMAEQADCVFAMDFQNKAELMTLYPSIREKILMLSAYAEKPWQYREIPDPYHGGVQATSLCGQQLRTCVRNLTASLLRGPEPQERGPAALDSHPGARILSAGKRTLSRQWHPKLA